MRQDSLGIVNMSVTTPHSFHRKTITVLAVYRDMLGSPESRGTSLPQVMFRGINLTPGSGSRSLRKLKASVAGKEKTVGQ
jgi:hypothetical protein